MKYPLFLARPLNWFKQLPAKRRVQVVLLSGIVVALILTYQLYRVYLESKANSDTVEAITYVSGSYCLEGDDDCNPNASIYSGLALSEPVTLTLLTGDRPEGQAAPTDLTSKPDPAAPPASSSTSLNTKPADQPDDAPPTSVEPAPDAKPVEPTATSGNQPADSPKNDSAPTAETTDNQPVSDSKKPAVKNDKPNIIRKTIAFLTGRPIPESGPATITKNQSPKPSNQILGWLPPRKTVEVDQSSPQANSAHTAGQRAKKMAKLDLAKKLLYAILAIDLALLGAAIYHTIRTRND